MVADEEPPPVRSRSRVLTELRNVRQIDGEGTRRWFYSRTFDLIVWYSASAEVRGFQLCYRIKGEQRALTWQRGGGFSHSRVDDGEGPGMRMKMTPILVADGVFDREQVLALFLEESAEIDPQVVEMVREKLKTYPPG